MKTNSWLLFLLFFLAVSCSDSRVSKRGTEAIKWKHAQLLSVDSCADSLLVTVKDPWRQGETLQHFGVASSGSLSVGTVVAPLKRIVCFSTAHCQLLEDLGMADRIIGVCDLKYILIPDIQWRVRAGRIADCGDAMNPDVEKIISLRPDAIILSPFEGGGGFGKLERFCPGQSRMDEALWPTAGLPAALRFVVSCGRFYLSKSETLCCTSPPRT